MISEPELVGGPDGPGAPRPQVWVEPQPWPQPAPGGRPEAPRARRPWLWALGGAALASALWAGGLYAYESRGPDLGAYRTDRDPCQVGRFDGLTSAIGPKGPSMNEPLKVDEPALFQWGCGVSLAKGSARYSASVDYALHRVTDPGPEFEARMTDPQISELGDRIGGLAEYAYVGELSGGGVWVRVVDGQAEISLTVMPEVWDEKRNRYVESPDLDPAALQTYLVEDMRQLMAALQR
ncbi:hypothetical protein ACIRQF_36970 [Streptomyces sp. NPDC101191]|uniref:hypothetical protein n=1 Tax=Streptomyces sp. NPDC101191 TaxID=3366126 RepID=UPI0038305C96